MLFPGRDGLQPAANLKTLEEGTNHPDRDRQFQCLNRQVRRFLRRGDPVISVDTKKKTYWLLFRERPPVAATREAGEGQDLRLY